MFWVFFFAQLLAYLSLLTKLVSGNIIEKPHICTNLEHFFTKLDLSSNLHFESSFLQQLMRNCCMMSVSPE